jgi:hypothetical protein
MEAICKELYNVVIPFKMQLTAQLYSIKPYEQVEFDMRIIDLKENVLGVNPFRMIKDKMMGKLDD